MANNIRRFESTVQLDSGLIIPFGGALGNKLVSDSGGKMWNVDDARESLQAGFLGLGGVTPITGAINSSTGVITLTNFPGSDWVYFAGSDGRPYIKAYTGGGLGAWSTTLPAAGKYRYVGLDLTPPTQPGGSYGQATVGSADQTTAALAAATAYGSAAPAAGNVRIWDGVILNTAGVYSLVSSVTSDAYCIPAATGRDRRPWARGALSVQVDTSSGGTRSTSSGTTSNLSPVFGARIECSGKPIEAMVDALFQNATSNTFIQLVLTSDGQGVTGDLGVMSVYNETWQSGRQAMWFTPSAGSHFITVEWAVSGGTALMYAQATIPAVFTIREEVRMPAVNGTA